MADNYISGEVIDEQDDKSSPVPDIDVIAVPHDEALVPIVEVTDQNGQFTFDEADLHAGDNKYHVTCRGGTISFPKRAAKDFTHILATGVTSWESFSPAPPHSYSMGGGYLESSIQSTNYSENDALVHEQDGYNDGTSWKYTAKSYNFSSYSTMTFSTEFSADGPYDQFEIVIGPDIVFSCDSGTIGSHSWTDRSVDVSGYNDVYELQIGHDVSGGAYRAVTSKIVDLSFQ